MSFAISLYLRLDRYKLLPWYRCPSITPSATVSLNSRHSLHGRDSLNYCVYANIVLSTRGTRPIRNMAHRWPLWWIHLAIFTTDFKTDRRTPPITSVRTDWQKDIGEDSSKKESKYRSGSRQEFSSQSANSVCYRISGKSRNKIIVIKNI